MGLGTGALKVSVVLAAMCREEVSMATLEAGSTPQSGNQYLLSDHILTKGPAYRGREWRVQEFAKDFHEKGSTS